MPKFTQHSDKEQVTQYIQNLEPDLGKIITYLRKLIFSTDTSIGEKIKWNNPGFIILVR